MLWLVLHILLYILIGLNNVIRLPLKVLEWLLLSECP